MAAVLSRSRSGERIELARLRIMTGRKPKPRNVASQQLLETSFAAVDFDFNVGLDAIPSICPGSIGTGI